MDITVYLPDEIGQRAKDEGLPLSQMLRASVIEHLSERDALASLLGSMETIELDLEDRVGRFRGTELAKGVYLHEDGRVLWYDEHKLRLHVLEDPVEDLRAILDEDEYVGAVSSLGLTPVVEI
jgi:hypothetical protein